MSPKSFLHNLGIKPSRKRKLSTRLNKVIETTKYAGDGNASDSDVMNAARMDSSFADEEIAMELLSDNFDRLANSIDRISKSPIFSKGKIQRVGELGGGTGIIGMWLAMNKLCEHCEIFDHAQNPLSMGSKWAINLSLKNLTFHHTSYAELAVSGSQNCEFAFAEHGVDLGYIPKHLDWSHISRDENDFHVLQRYKELAGAFKKILLPTGVGLIGGGLPSPASLSLLCAALREQQLFIDWKISSNMGGFFLYVRPQGQIVINSTEDEALAILADALPARKIHPAEARSLEIMFQQGTKFVEIYSEANDVTYKCSMFQRAGFGCAFQRNTQGYEIATLFSAAKLHTWTNDILRDANKRKIITMFVDDRVK